MIHMSVRKNAAPAFAVDDYSGMSDALQIRPEDACVFGVS